MQTSRLFAPLAVVVRCGDLELRGLDDQALGELVTVAQAGIHPPDFMPFLVPWTDSLAAGPEKFLQYHWHNRATFSVQEWQLHLGAWWQGELVGTQGVRTEDFQTTRTGETGSWLGKKYQGRGIGTAMRRAMCALMFDELGAKSVTSSAFQDNNRSLRVSQKVGYLKGMADTRERRGMAAPYQELVLHPQNFDRGNMHFVYEGTQGLRNLIGI
jgi:RimJ/RimL family protein N-acetyltransferase